MLDWFFDRLIAWPEQLNRVSLRVSGYQSRSVPTSFGELSYLEGEGEGRLPLMLLHGFSAEGPHYVTLMQLLRSHASRLYVPDLPAHGQSSAPPASMEPGQLRAEIVEALDRILVEPTVIYGNSLGGMVALYYALARPEKVRGLILCSPAGAAMDRDELVRLMSAFQLSDYGEALAFVDRLFVRPTPLRRLIAWGVRHKFANPTLQALLRSIGPDHLLTPEELAALTMPTLLVWGKEDRILPRSSFEFYRSHLPPSTTLIEEPHDQSHTPYLEDAGAVADRIVRFMIALERR